jgi:N-ethylmaleimide reductase
MIELMREQYRGTLVLAGGFDLGTAEAWLRQGKADLIAFGRKFLANLDRPNGFPISGFPIEVVESSPAVSLVSPSC